MQGAHYINYEASKNVLKIAKYFESIQTLNWAWFYKNQQDGQWHQFNCDDCMIIEYRFQIYSNTNDNEEQLKESIRHVILGHCRLDL